MPFACVIKHNPQTTRRKVEVRLHAFLTLFRIMPWRRGQHPLGWNVCVRQTARTYDIEYKKKLLTTLGIESRVLCHPPDGMSSVRCLCCADAQGIKVKFPELKPRRTVFQSVSIAKCQHATKNSYSV